MVGFVKVKVSGADSYRWVLFNTLVTTHDALANTTGTGCVNMFSVYHFTVARSGAETCALHSCHASFLSLITACCNTFQRVATAV